MNVLVVTPWFPGPGSPYSGVFVQHQVEALRSAGHEVDVQVPVMHHVLPGEVAGALAAMAEVHGAGADGLTAEFSSASFFPMAVPHLASLQERVASMRWSLALRRHATTGRRWITHAHVGVPTALALRQLGVAPLVVTEHYSLVSAILADDYGRRSYARVVREADAFCCVSEQLKAQIVAALGEWSERRIEVVPNVVDLSDIPFVERDRAPGRRWIYVGGLARHKGIPLLLESFEHYVRRFDPEAELTLVGDGPLRRWIEGRIERRHLHGAVDVVGAVDHNQLATFLTSADVFVHLSQAETFGVAALEAMGAGLPVVSLAHAGALETWGDVAAVAGELVPIGSSAATVAAAVDRLSRNSVLRPAAARRYVEAQFGPDVFAERMTGLYRSVV